MIHRLALLVLCVCLPASASFINYASREINVKVVYVGPGQGPHTNLTYIYGKTNPEAKGKMVQLATEGGKTQFFDFLPLSLGEIRGFKVRFHLYTSVSEPGYAESRRLILKGVDGLVFVAQSDPKLAKENIRAFDELKADLASLGYDWKAMPLVVQFDGRDAANARPVETLRAELGLSSQPQFESVSTTGVGVFDSLKSVAKLVLMELRRGAGPADAGTSAKR